MFQTAWAKDIPFYSHPFSLISLFSSSFSSLHLSFLPPSYYIPFSVLLSLSVCLSFSLNLCLSVSVSFSHTHTHTLYLFLSLNLPPKRLFLSRTRIYTLSPFPIHPHPSNRSLSLWHIQITYHFQDVFWERSSVAISFSPPQTWKGEPVGSGLVREHAVKERREKLTASLPVQQGLWFSFKHLRGKENPACSLRGELSLLLLWVCQSQLDGVTWLWRYTEIFLIAVFGEDGTKRYNNSHCCLTAQVFWGWFPVKQVGKQIHTHTYRNTDSYTHRNQVLYRHSTVRKVTVPQRTIMK